MTPPSEHPDHIAMLLRIHDIADRFDAVWQAAERGGMPPRIEDYLADTTEPSRAALLRELLAVELVCALDTG